MIRKLLFILFLVPTLMLSQQTLSGTFEPAEDYKWYIIYKLTSYGQKYIANGDIVNGKLLHTFASDTPKGMYRIVYALPQDSENFDFIYNGKENISFTLKEDNSEFTESEENRINVDYLMAVNNIKREINAFYQTGSTDEKSFLEIFQKLEDIQNSFEKSSKGMIVHDFIKANRSYIPTTFEEPRVLVEHLNKHYFTHIDFKNARLQHSEFLTDKAIAYVFTAIPLKELSGKELIKIYEENIDTVAKKMKETDKEFQKTVMMALWNQMVMMENDGIANYITDEYLISLAEATNDEELKENLQNFKRLAIGQKAPEFEWKHQGKEFSLTSLEQADNYVLVFWSSTCSHCLKELPKLKSFMDSQQEKNITVIAIGLEDEAANWEEEIKNYPSFLHVLGLDKWDNEIGNTYDVSSTPTFFVLDSDKTIINKPYGVKELEDFFQQL